MPDVVYGCQDARADLVRYFAGTEEPTQTQRCAFERAKRHMHGGGVVICSPCWSYYQELITNYNM